MRAKRVEGMGRDDRASIRGSKDREDRGVEKIEREERIEEV